MLSRYLTRSTFSSLAMAVTLATSPALSPVSAQQRAAEAQPARKSSLPDAALHQARQAEQHLAADQPDQAIAILRDLDKKHPGNSAISLRLAQIHDTLNRNGHALFYYRRYMQLAGGRAREMAVERVTSLELMAGIDDDAEAAAREIGETTRPVATPIAHSRRMLATEAKDGSLVPINSEEELMRIQKQGLPESAPVTPVATRASGFVIPQELAASPRAVGSPVASEPSPAARAAAPVATSPPVVENRQAPAQRASVYAESTPRPPDEDALLANAFRKSDSAEQIADSIKVESNPGASDPSPAAPSEPTPAPAQKTTSIPKPQPTQAAVRNTPAPARPTAVPTPLTDQRTIAYTQQAPQFESARAASFFNVTQGNSPMASIVIMNQLKSAVVTVSIIPEDDSDAASAILMPGESRTLNVNPARYDVTANAATTDYSPITLMNTQFKYTFHGNRQYTRRFTETSLQQAN